MLHSTQKVAIWMDCKTVDIWWMMGFPSVYFSRLEFWFGYLAFFCFKKFQAIPLIEEAGKLLILVKTVTRQNEGEAFDYSK